MYLRTREDLHGFGDNSSCAGWERDRQSLSKVVAEHYVRTELGRELHGNPNWCSEGGKLCEVQFPDGIRIMVSFVGVPGYLIARQVAKNAPRREYTYECLGDSRIVFHPR